MDIERINFILDKVIFIGLIILVFLIPLIPNLGVTNYKLFIARIIIIFIFLLGMFQYLILEKPIKKTFFYIPFLIFLFLAFLSFVFSQYKSASLYQFFEYFILIIVVLTAINNIDKKKELIYLINTWIISAFLVSLYAIFQVLGLDLFNQGKGLPSFSTYGNPNLLASFLVISLPFAIASFSYGRESLFKRSFFLVSILTMSISVLLTLSRAGIGCLFLLFFTYVFLYVRNSKKNKLKMVAVVLLFAFIIGIFFSLYIYDNRVRNLLKKEMTRYYIWKNTFNIIRQRPLFGYGVGSFPICFSVQNSPELFYFYPPSQQFVTHAHNEFLEITLEMGIIGLVSFLFIIISVLKKAFGILNILKDNYLSNILKGAIVAVLLVLVYSMVNVGFRFIGVNIFFFLCLAIIVIIDINKKGGIV